MELYQCDCVLWLADIRIIFPECRPLPANWYEMAKDNYESRDRGFRYAGVDYSNILPDHRGIGMHSRTFSIPPSQLISRSNPIPYPPCGAPPNLRSSVYHR